MDRYYVACTYCERYMAVNIEEGNTIEEVAEAVCPLCNEKALRIMGKVRQNEVVREGVKAACDERCTNARGPLCTCLCSQVNHGTKKLIKYDKFFRKLEVVEKDLLARNEEYLARIKRMAAAKVDIKQRVLAFLEWKNKKILDWLKQPGNSSWRLANEEYTSYLKYLELKKRIDKIEDFRSIQKKINSLVKMIPQIGPTLDYIEAVALAKGLVK